MMAASADSPKAIALLLQKSAQINMKVSNDTASAFILGLSALTTQEIDTSHFEIAQTRSLYHLRINQVHLSFGLGT